MFSTVVCLYVSANAAAQSAQAVGAWPSKTRIGLVYGVFGGDQYKAITNKSTAFGAEVGIVKGSWKFANLIGKVRGLYFSGQEDFLDGSTAHPDLSYTMFATEPGIGIHINLMPYYPPGIRVYVLGLGLMSYDHIRIDKNTDFTTINNSDTNLGFGYEIGAGIEWNFKREKGLWALWGEVQYRNVTTKLAGQDRFQLNGLQMVGGISW